MSITNIVAIAMLSGSPQCPPVSEPSSTVKAANLVQSVTIQPQAPLPNADNIISIASVSETDQNAAPPSISVGADTMQTNAPPTAEKEFAQPQSSETPTDDGLTTSVSPDQNTIIVTARTGPPAGDPIEVVNEVAFGAVQAVDEAIVAPVAQGYEDALPEPIRDGINNVLNNLDEPIVFVNFLLQLKIGKALETVGRFAINSTVGVAGLFDVAKKKPFNLPRRPNGLADTLGFYGVGPGPYLFLPLVGSTTVRDLFGRVLDLALLPTAVGKPFTNPLVSTSKGVLSSINERVNNDAILTRVQQSGNPYAAMREYYLKKRQAEIDVLKGKRCNAHINLEDLEFMDSLPEVVDKPLVQSSSPQMK